MTQIEVPDWVARIADEAGDEFAKTHTMSMYASVADMQLDCVRHMLTAALGAWVVPVYQIRSESNRTWSEFKPEHYARILADNDDGLYEGRILYDLRQEKPE